MNNFFSLQDFKDIYAGQFQIKEIYLGTQKIYSSQPLILSVIINNPFPSEVDPSFITIFDRDTGRIYYDGSELMGTEDFAVDCSVDGFYANYRIDTSEEGKVIMKIDIKASDRILSINLDNNTDMNFGYSILVKYNGKQIEYTGYNSEEYVIPYDAEVSINYMPNFDVMISPYDYWEKYTNNSIVYITVIKYTGDYLCHAAIKSNINLCPKGQAEDWFPSYTTITLYFRGEIIYQDYLSIENQYGGELFYFDENVSCPDTPKQGDLTCSIIYEDPYPDNPHIIEFSNSVDFTVWEDLREISITINVDGY